MIVVLIIGGFYKDEVDLYCCWYVFVYVWGFDFLFEILGFLFYVRLIVVRFVYLLKVRVED